MATSAFSFGDLSLVSIEPSSLVTGPLAEALEKGRGRFNARFDLARRLDRDLDPTAFSEHLRLVVDPIARAVAVVQPDRAGATAEALFDLSLELFAKDCLGPLARKPAAGQAWRSVLPAAASLLAQEPRRVAAAVTNGALNLAAQPGARGGEWLQDMQRLAPLCPSVELYLKAGQVAAWRCGIAHFRTGALALLSDLPDEVLFLALALSGIPRPERAALLKSLQDPWADPKRSGLEGRPGLAIVARVGGFRGFGGPFLAPPEVFALDGQLYAFDPGACWSLHAGCFGATFQRYGPDLPKGDLQQGGAFTVAQSGEVRRAGLACSFPVLSGAKSFASNGTTLAVTLHRSHRIYLVAEVRA